MTREERYYARVLFKLKVHESNGQAYENLFVQVMEKSNPNFRPIKPRGSIGDQKNDGFDKQAGKYYQVYAPEELSEKNKKFVQGKITSSFEGLRSFWDSIGTVNEYYFVVNDKYAGVYPDIEKELSDLEQASGIRCEPFLAKDLEQAFISLNEDDILAIVGNIIPPSTIFDIDYEALGEVIEHLLQIEVHQDPTVKIPQNPAFEEKIQFNQLSAVPASLLRVGSFQKYAIDDFFKRNSSYLKEVIRSKFNTLYLSGTNQYRSDEDRNDLIFWHIHQQAYPDNRRIIYDAKVVLMAYYFEYCDIFEEAKPLNS